MLVTISVVMMMDHVIVLLVIQEMIVILATQDIMSQIQSAMKILAQVSKTV